MENIFENFLLKTRVFPTKIYGPTEERLKNIAKKEDMEPGVVLNWFSRKWRINYIRACEILDQMLQERYGLRYKEVERPGIKISLKE